VLGLAVVVGRRLVDEGRIHGADQWVDEPCIPGRGAAADKVGTPSGFGREQVTLAQLRGFNYIVKGFVRMVFW
jgi:hypothetical protein